MLIITCLSLLLEIFGHVFISLASTSAYWLYFIDKRFVFYMALITQLADVGGLVHGRMCGKRPFMQRISPKKTMEGFFGQLLWSVGASVLSFLYCKLLGPDNGHALPLPLGDYIILGVICGMLASLGDLIESFIKRCANIKDSGTALGAHGGVFDRIDSMLLVCPFLLWYALQYEKFHKKPEYGFDQVHLFEFLTVNPRWTNPGQLISPLK